MCGARHADPCPAGARACPRCAPSCRYMDEVLGFALAALGFYTQLRMGFGLPFLASIVLFPVSCLEYVIEYMVSSA